jgi:hypothetical protein
MPDFSLVAGIRTAEALEHASIACKKKERERGNDKTSNVETISERKEDSLSDVRERQRAEDEGNERHCATDLPESACN